MKRFSEQIGRRNAYNEQRLVLANYTPLSRAAFIQNRTFVISCLVKQCLPNVEESSSAVNLFKYTPSVSVIEIKANFIINTLIIHSHPESFGILQNPSESSFRSVSSDGQCAVSSEQSSVCHSGEQ